MIVLDTNVISELMLPVPNPAVVAWVNARPAPDFWTTAITVFEIRFGLATMAAGHKRQARLIAFEDVLRLDLNGRVLDFDAAAADATALIAARCKAAGRPMEVRDAMIAGTVAAAAATLATRNTRHFALAGIALVDPWSAAP